MQTDIQRIKTQGKNLSAKAQEEILDSIRRGTFKPGERLPTEANLAAQLGISRATVREALMNLGQNGVIVREHGRGTFVAKRHDVHLESQLEQHESVLQLAARAGIPTRFVELSVEQIPATPELATALKISSGTAVTRVDRVILVGDTPAAYMTDFVPASILAPPDIDDQFNGSVLDLLRGKRRFLVSLALTKIEAVNAVSLVASKLRVQPGEALLLFHETLLDEHETALDFSLNYFVPEFFQFHVSRRYSRGASTTPADDIQRGSGPPGVESLRQGDTQEPPF